VSSLCLAHHAVRLWRSPRRWPREATNPVQIRWKSHVSFPLSEVRWPSLIRRNRSTHMMWCNTLQHTWCDATHCNIPHRVMSMCGLEVSHTYDIHFTRHDPVPQWVMSHTSRSMYMSCICVTYRPYIFMTRHDSVPQWVMSHMTWLDMPRYPGHSRVSCICVTWARSLLQNIVSFIGLFCKRDHVHVWTGLESHVYAMYMCDL